MVACFITTKNYGSYQDAPHLLGLLYKNHEEFRRFIWAILALPLPAEEMEPTLNQLMLLPLHASPSQIARINVLKRYLTRNWIKHTQSIELSVHHAEVSTNNGVESYHKKLKTYIETPHPIIWSFISSLNNIIADCDADLQRLQNGIDITRMECRREREKCQVRGIG